jgi:hypothetical protein
MKRIVLLLTLLILIRVAHAQPDSKSLLSELGNLTDQYDHPFDKAKGNDKLVIIFVSGGDDPFTKVYDKLKGKSLKNSSEVQIVGGFEEMLSAGGHGGSDDSGMKSHISDAFISRYGDKHFSILIDMKSSVAKKASVKGLSVIIMSKKSNKVESLTDFGTDRKKFFDAINPYFK